MLIFLILVTHRWVTIEAKAENISCTLQGVCHVLLNSTKHPNTEQTVLGDCFPWQSDTPLYPYRVSSVLLGIGCRLCVTLYTMGSQMFRLMTLKISARNSLLSFCWFVFTSLIFLQIYTIWTKDFGISGHITGRNFYDIPLYIHMRQYGVGSLYAVRRHGKPRFVLNVLIWVPGVFGMGVFFRVWFRLLSSSEGSS